MMESKVVYILVALNTFYNFTKFLISLTRLQLV